jgi:uncharacterized RDD family membrane protein YckC
MHGHNPYAAPRAPPADPHAHWDPFFPAERSQRLIASVVDWFIVCLALPPGVIAGIAVGDEPGIVAGFVVGAFCWLCIEIVQWSMIASRGQSIGKRVMGIRVIRISGQPVDFVYGVLLREWLPMLITGAVGAFSFVDVLFIFRDDRRCLHDWIAQTRVVRAESSPPRFATW